MCRNRRVAAVAAILLGLAAILAACSNAASSAEDAKARSSAGERTTTEHEHQPPHGGTLIELGEELAHLELVLDPVSGRVTAYVLDGEAEQPVRLEQPSLALTISDLPSAGEEVTVVLQALANILTGETVGASSQFQGASDRLRGAERFRGRVTEVTVRGQTFTSVAFRFPEGNEE